MTVHYQQLTLKDRNTFQPHEVSIYSLLKQQFSICLSYLLIEVLLFTDKERMSFNKVIIV